MNRWLMIGSLAVMLIGSTGCMQQSLRGGVGCASGSCASGCTGCGNAQCNGSCGSGLLGKLCSRCGNNCNGNCGAGGSGVLGRLGGMCGLGGCGGGSCVSGPIGWQQGGLDYSAHLQPGLLGHNAAANLNSRPFTPGPPTAQIGYPYYTVRGPRDFLTENPPTIGR